jgi:hypothetical protein
MKKIRKKHDNREQREEIRAIIPKKSMQKKRKQNCWGIMRLHGWLRGATEQELRVILVACSKKLTKN